MLLLLLFYDEIIGKGAIGYIYVVCFMLLRRSFNILIIGVAPIPRLIRKRISYFLQFCAGAPCGPSINILGNLITK
jgi:hypothetical protein